MSEFSKCNDQNKQRHIILQANLGHQQEKQRQWSNLSWDPGHPAPMHRSTHQGFMPHICYHKNDESWPSVVSERKVQRPWIPSTVLSSNAWPFVLRSHQSSGNANVMAAILHLPVSTPRDKGRKGRNPLWIINPYFWFRNYEQRAYMCVNLKS